MAHKIEVLLPNGDKLVASGNDLEYREIYIYLENCDGVPIQDLVIVGSKYIYDNYGVKLIDDEFYVDVYADENQEDYTNTFDIRRCREED